MWLFFRVDDLGWNPKEFSRLITLFARHDQKLNAAAIPTAINSEIIKQSIPYSYQASPFLQVVTHGYNHENHQIEGKKCEFGEDRKIEEIRSQLIEGRRILTNSFENYFPCFVPPWNRMSADALGLLPECGYKMLSRMESDKAQPQSLVPEFSVTLDLHTNKTEPKLSAKEIFLKLAKANEDGRDFIGVMLHHNKMDDSDFETLDQLLKSLSMRSIQSVFFSDMIPGYERRSQIEVGHV